MKMNKKGFTLIELLVVIAIIGILSAVVLASLNSARAKGSDAAAKSGMSNFQSQAAIYYDSAGNQTYNTTGATTTSCTAANTVFDPSSTQDAQGATIISNISSNASSISCSSAPSTFAISVSLKSGSGNWCVDSNGNATTTAIQSDGLCI